MYGTLIPLRVCFHSDVFQECVRVAIAMQTYVLQVCRNAEETTHLVSP